MKNSIRDVLINLAASSLFALIFFLAGLVGVTSAVIIALSASLLISVYLIFRSSETKMRKWVGIEAVSPGPNDDVEQMLSDARHSIDFLGVTANRTARSPVCREAILKVAENSGRIRFLLLNPSSVHLDRRAQDEGDDAESWRTEIEGSVRRLEMIKNEGANISVRFYDAYPLFRMVNLDNTTMHMNWFLDGRPGHNCPELTLRVDRVGLAAAVSRHFEELWSSGVNAIAPLGAAAQAEPPSGVVGEESPAAHP